MSVESYCYKSIESGKVIELYMYHNKMYKRKTEDTNDILKEINSWDITENLKEIEKKEKDVKKVQEEEIFIKPQKTDISLRRTQKRLKRLINSNLGVWNEQDKFLTLTCPKLKSREKACRMLKTFFETLRYNYGSQIQYISVMEIQDGDRLEDKSKATKDIHFHILLFNCPYIPQDVLQNKIWKHGIVDIRKIDEFGDIAGYLANYLSKDDTLAVKGKRGYSPSKGLKKPIEKVSSDEQMLFDVLGNKENEVKYTETYCLENVGKITYFRLQKKDNDRLN